MCQFGNKLSSTCGCFRRYVLSMALSAGGGVPEARRVEARVQEAVPGAVLRRSAAAELSFKLPLEDTGAYPDLLEALESGVSPRVEQLSISMPTLVRFDSQSSFI